MKYTLTACVMVLCLPVSATQDDDEAPDFSHIDRTKFNREMIHNKGSVKSFKICLTVLNSLFISIH